LVYLYSTIKMMHGAMNLRFKKTLFCLTRETAGEGDSSWQILIFHSSLTLSLCFFCI